MKLAISVLLLSFVSGCTPKTNESSARSTSSETSENSGSTSGETATVAGKVEQEDTGDFTNEIDVEDWSTFEAQNTAGTNLLLTQENGSATDEKVSIYRLGKDAGGTHNFLPEASVDLSSENTFLFQVEAYTYYVVKYKTLTGFVPALAKDTILPLVLNAESSVAVNLFIRMVQTQDGKDLVDQKKISSTVLESLAKKITTPGVTDYKAVISSVLEPALSQQKEIINDQPKTPAELAAIVSKIIDAAVTSDTLTQETKNVLVEAAAAQVQNAGQSTSSLANPSNLTVGSTMKNQLTLQWSSAGSSAAGYRISYNKGATAPSSCSSGTKISESAISGLSHQILNLLPGTTYTFRVCSINSETPAKESKGATVSSATLFEDAYEPTNFTALAIGTTQINLSWLSGHTSTAGYKISFAIGTTVPSSCDDGYIVSANKISGTTATIESLNSDTAYSFRLCALASNPDAPASAGVTLTQATLQAAPNNPTNFTAVSNQINSIQLNWASGGGSTADYRISYQAGPVPPSTCFLGTIVAASAVNGTSYLVSNLLENTEYSFRVCAINSNPTPTLSSGVTATETTEETASDIMHLLFERQGNLYYISGESGNWQSPILIETGLDNNVTFKSFDVALDSNREPYIALVNNAGSNAGSVRHYTKISNSWSHLDSEKVLVPNLTLNASNSNISAMFESSGKLQILAALPTYQALYTTKKATSASPVNSGVPNDHSACVDRNDTLWVAYGSSSNLYLKSRQKDAAFWTISAPLAMQSVGNNHCLTGSTIVADDIDCRNEKITIAFRCHSGSNADETIGYVYNSQQRWLTDAAPTSVNPEANNISYLKNIVIHRDASDRVHLSSLSGYTALDARYWLDGVEIVDAKRENIDDNGLSSNITMTVDSNNSPHFFFIDIVNSNYALNHRYKSGANWVEEVAHAGNGLNYIDLSTSIAIESNSGKSNWTPSHELFVATRSSPAVVGTLSNFDAACESAASALGKKGFKALLSLSNANAKDRVVISGPVYNMAGSQIVGDSTEFWSGVWDTNAAYSANGTAFSDPIFTGSTAQGVYSGNNCNNFSQSLSVSTTYSTGITFSSSTLANCESAIGFWCLSQP